ncbi:hypothetical protein K438DRAFT_1835619 [Mycena galopus ATCC 62051]|nr:hypothetical protein K438DRAFT_1835619 [Mycena galopus ATCC 62051]
MKITGGLGGAGGSSDLDGGWGGTSSGPVISNTLVSLIEDETRRRVPHTKLEELKVFGINDGLCKLLKDHGFRTAGGLFEAETDDLKQASFKLGQIGVVRAALKKFAKAYN